MAEEKTQAEKEFLETSTATRFNYGSLADTPFEAFKQMRESIMRGIHVAIPVMALGGKYHLAEIDKGHGVLPKEQKLIDDYGKNGKQRKYTYTNSNRNVVNVRPLLKYKYRDVSGKIRYLNLPDFQVNIQRISHGGFTMSPWKSSTWHATGWVISGDNDISNLNRDISLAMHSVSGDRADDESVWNAYCKSAQTFVKHMFTNGIFIPDNFAERRLHLINQATEIFDKEHSETAAEGFEGEYQKNMLYIGNPIPTKDEDKQMFKEGFFGHLFFLSLKDDEITIYNGASEKTYKKRKLDRKKYSLVRIGGNDIFALTKDINRNENGYLTERDKDGHYNKHRKVSRESMGCLRISSDNEYNPIRLDHLQTDFDEEGIIRNVDVNRRLISAKRGISFDTITNYKPEEKTIERIRKLSLDDDGLKYYESSDIGLNSGRRPKKVDVENDESYDTSNEVENKTVNTDSGESDSKDSIEEFFTQEKPNEEFVFKEFRSVIDDYFSYDIKDYDTEEELTLGKEGMQIRREITTKNRDEDDLVVGESKMSFNLDGTYYFVGNPRLERYMNDDGSLSEKKARSKTTIDGSLTIQGKPLLVNINADRGSYERKFVEIPVYNPDTEKYDIITTWKQRAIKPSRIVINASRVEIAAKTISVTAERQVSLKGSVSCPGYCIHA